MSHKRNIIFGLVFRILLLSQFHFQKNLEEAITILFNNCYSFSFICYIIRTRLKCHSNKVKNRIQREKNNIELLKRIFLQFLMLC